MRMPGIEPSSRRIAIAFEGEAVEALEGETVAAALTAAGLYDLRRTREDKPRGIFCGMGVCFDCLVSIDGQPSQRACLTKVRDGMRVARQPHRGDVSSVQPLAALPDGPLAVRRCELLIVGAGPAGLAAAETAARSGIEVVIADERLEPGGQFYKQLAPSHHFTGVAADLQYAEGRALIERVRNLNVEILSETVVWGAFPDEPDDDGRSALELGIVCAGRAERWRPQQLILATGAYERPLPVPGWTLPGFMTTGAAQTLARSYGVSPGRRILIAGNGPLNLQVACELARGGADIAAVVEAAARPGPRHIFNLAMAAWRSPDLIRQGRQYIRFLKERGIQLLYGHALVSAEGRDRVESVRIAKIDTNGSALLRSARSFAVDAVCAGYGFISSTELTRLIGCEHEVDAFGNLTVVRGADGATSIAGVFAVGDCGSMGGSRVALSQGRLAGLSVAKRLGRDAKEHAAERSKLMRVLNNDFSFQRVLWTIFSAPPMWRLAARDADVLVCRCEDVTLRDVRTCFDRGLTDIGSIKKVTRAGMGRCQGRYCGPLLAELCADASGRPRDAFSQFAPRLPVKPLPAVSVACEKGEWVGHGEVELPQLQTRPSGRRAELKTAGAIVIGGGVLGSCTTYYLAKRGLDVFQLERGSTNSEASGGNAGSLHVQLLAYDFGEWAIKGGKPAAATLPLQRDSAKLWPELEKELGGDFEIHITGGLMVAEDDKMLDHLRRKTALERSCGIEVDVISGTELRAMAPAVSERMIGAAWCPAEGKINPMLATPAINRGAVAAGARLFTGAEVLDIERGEGGFLVKTGRGDFRAPRVLNAAGAWSSRIAAMVGIELPTRASPLQMIVTEPVPHLVNNLLAHANRHLTMKQAANSNLIIGGGWRATFDRKSARPRVRRDSFEGNLWAAAQVLPALSAIHVIRSWSAMNVSIDGAPILGEAPGVPGFFNAVTVNGVTMGPLIGWLNAEMMATGSSSRCLEAYSLARF